MILQKKKGIGIEKFVKYTEKFSFSSFVKTHIILFILILINFVIHIYPVVSRTILLGYDEPTLVQSGLGLFTRISAVFQRFLNIEFLTFTRILYFVLIVALVLFWKKIRTFFTHVVDYFNNHGIARILLFLLFILLSYIYFVIIRNTAFHEALFRYPPMSKFLYFITYTIFGIEEFAPRLIQVALGSIGVVYLYRLILLYYNKKTALLGVIIFLFSPLTSYYFNYAELGLGTVSVTIIISFYFIRFLKYKCDNDLLITFFLIGVGFLYKRSILLMLILISFYLIISNFSYIKDNYPKILKLLWASLIPILPFVIIMSRYTPRGYRIDLSILTDKILQYFNLLIETHSYVMVVLFCLSFIFILFKDKNNLTLFISILFIGFYLFYSLDSYPIAIERFSLSFIPAIALFSAVFIYNIFHKKEFITNTIIVLFGIYLISISTFIQLSEIQPKFVLYKNYLFEHYPTDKALKWIIDNHNAKNILGIEVRNIAFYRDKLKINKNRISSVPVEDFNEKSKDELDKFIKKNSIGCIIASNGRGSYKTDNIVSNDFTSTKEFKYDNGNKIILYLR
jgi:hypothetical protein